MELTTEKTAAVLHIHKDEAGIFWTMSLEQTKTPPVRIDIQGSADRHFVWRSLMKSAQPIFYHLLPVPSLEVQIGQEILEDESIAPAVQEFANIVRGTNRMLNEFAPQFNIAAGFENTFFYSPDDHPHLKGIYEATKAAKNCETFYEVCSTGWNPVIRAWERPLFLPIREILRTLVEKKVKRFITVNHYFLSHHQLQGVFILPLFEKLGIEYICYYGDTSEGISPIEVAAFDWEGFRNYQIASHLQRDWNQIYNIRSGKPHSTGYFLKRSYDIEPLDKDFGILIASNSRIHDLKVNFLQLLYIFETSTRDENIFDDFQIWFMAMRRLLLHHIGLVGPMRESAGLAVYQFYVNGISLLKFLVIDSLKTSRQIKIFGDNGWGQLFPNLYQNQYLNDADYQAFTQSRKYMVLLMNASIYYPDANPVLHKAIDASVPYLGYPATVRTPEFEGFKALEYRNFGELNSILDSVNERAADATALATRKYFIDMIHGLFNAMVADFSGQTPGYDLKTNAYAVSTQSHLQLLDERTEKYIREHQALMQEQILKIFYNHQFQFKFEDSRFCNRPLMKTLNDLSQRLN